MCSGVLEAELTRRRILLREDLELSLGATEVVPAEREEAEPGEKVTIEAKMGTP